MLQCKRNLNFKLQLKDFYIIAFVLLNNKGVPDFTGSTDEPLDFGNESSRIFIKVVSRKYCSYQNTSTETYRKAG